MARGSVLSQMCIRDRYWGDYCPASITEDDTDEAKTSVFKFEDMPMDMQNVLVGQMFTASDVYKRQLPEALEDCIEAKQHRDAAERFDAEFKQKQEAKLEREGT